MKLHIIWRLEDTGKFDYNLIRSDFEYLMNDRLASGILPDVTGALARGNAASNRVLGVMNG